jgi:hypothetical protein
MVPVYFPARTKVASRWRMAMAVLIWASKPEILGEIVSYEGLS